jgi:hypothetical protein
MLPVDRTIVLKYGVWLVKYKLCTWLYLVQSMHMMLSVNRISGKALFHIQVLKRVLISITGTG